MVLYFSAEGKYMQYKDHGTAHCVWPCRSYLCLQLFICIMANRAQNGYFSNFCVTLLRDCTYSLCSRGYENLQSALLVSLQTKLHHTDLWNTCAANKNSASRQHFVLCTLVGFESFYILVALRISIILLPTFYKSTSCHFSSALLQ